MSRFIQLHLLTSYPPSNLNRDDLGRPKSAQMGGANRLRISSQALKRAWRKSELFESALKGHIGTRTKEIGVKVFKDLVARGVKESDARDWAKKIAEQFGAAKKPKDANSEEALHIEQLAHFSPAELAAIDALTATLAQTKTEPTPDQLKLLRRDHAAVDIALFGRMLAAKPEFNTEAAAQVAHAITVHAVTVEDDWFSAVDDLNTGMEDRGAGHIGEAAFGAGVFYLYICINREQLLASLNGDVALRDQTLAAFLEAVAKISPTGKQNSFASRAYASYVMAEKGDQQPRSLSLAFLKPVTGDDYGAEAIKRLQQKCEAMDRMYGACADARLDMHEGNTVTLAGLSAFITA